jgi:chromatin segregation and condensation protein Rec8/ScpA/Scc1 (kleisin family)
VLELYKQGELTWTQPEPFGEIQIEASARAAPPLDGAPPSPVAAGPGLTPARLST